MDKCPKCGAKVFHNKGISSKTNKPYENYKCGSCDFIEWVGQKDKGGNTSSNTNEIMKLLKAIYNDIQILKAKNEETPIIEDET